MYLEAPVVGSRVPALEGQLTILASGDRKLFDDCFSCFEAIGKKSLFLGKSFNSFLSSCVNREIRMLFKFPEPKVSKRLLGKRISPSLSVFSRDTEVYGPVEIKA